MLQKILKVYLLLGISFAYSQTYEDVVRYNSFYHDGSSRFNSMGGAFGALGGDLSSISINPAGSSVFLESEFGISLNYKSQEIGNNFNNSLSTILGTSTSSVIKSSNSAKPLGYFAKSNFLFLPKLFNFFLHKYNLKLCNYFIQERYERTQYINVNWRHTKV